MPIEMVPLDKIPADVRAVLDAAAESRHTTVQILRTDRTTRFGALMRTAMWYLATRLEPPYTAQQVAGFCGRANVSTVREARSIAASKVRARDEATLAWVELFDRAVAAASGQAAETEIQALRRRLDAAERELAEARRNIRILQRIVRSVEAALHHAGVQLPPRHA